MVRARIDIETKKRAVVPEAMGLSVSDAIRLLTVRIAEEQQLPYAVQMPNKATAKAIDELETG